MFFSLHEKQTVMTMVAIIRIISFQFESNDVISGENQPADQISHSSQKKHWKYLSLSAPIFPHDFFLRNRSNKIQFDEKHTMTIFVLDHFLGGLVVIWMIQSKLQNVIYGI